MLLEYKTVHYSKAIILCRHQLIIKTLNPSCKFPLDMTASCPIFSLTLQLSPYFWLLLYFHAVRRSKHYINHLTPDSPFFLASFSIRVINAGKSMLNEDQASCEKLFVKKPSSKQRNSSLLEDNGVSEGPRSRT